MAIELKRLGEIGNQQTVDLIEAEEAYASPISVSEMAIKHGLDKMELPSARIAADIEAQGFPWLNMTPYHAQTVLELPGHHKDPFDRLLIAQAQYQSMRIATYDAVFQNYLADALIVGR